YEAELQELQDDPETDMEVQDVNSDEHEHGSNNVNWTPFGGHLSPSSPPQPTPPLICDAQQELQERKQEWEQRDQEQRQLEQEQQQEELRPCYTPFEMDPFPLQYCTMGMPPPYGPRINKQVPLPPHPTPISQPAQVPPPRLAVRPAAPPVATLPTLTPASRIIEVHKPADSCALSSTPQEIPSQQTGAKSEGEDTLNNGSTRWQADTILLLVTNAVDLDVYAADHGGKTSTMATNMSKIPSKCGCSQCTPDTGKRKLEDCYTWKKNPKGKKGQAMEKLVADHPAVRISLASVLERLMDCRKHLESMTKEQKEFEKKADECQKAATNKVIEQSMLWRGTRSSVQRAHDENICPSATPPPIAHSQPTTPCRHRKQPNPDSPTTKCHKRQCRQDPSADELDPYVLAISSGSHPPAASDLPSTAQPAAASSSQDVRFDSDESTVGDFGTPNV
ncbi:hypothetical protein OF83DRAFT_1089617, partial [Amylostereum chailletii]